MVVSTCLPEVVTRSLRAKLLDLVLDFGVRANQEEVLVVVGVFAHRFRFARTIARGEFDVEAPSQPTFPALAENYMTRSALPTSTSSSPGEARDEGVSGHLHRDRSV